MRNTLSRVQCGQTLVNLGQKYESFDGVVKSRFGRQILQGLQNFDHVYFGLT